MPPASHSPPSISLEKPSPESRHTVPGRKLAVRRVRTKTGCTTCRIRRVKCDELKPACVRCTSTGRKCDGYTPTPNVCKRSGSNSEGKVDILLRNPGSLGTASEQRGLVYFRTRTAGFFSGYFDSDFWSTLVLQASDFEPTIRHAVLALSSMYEGFEVGGDVPNEQNNNHRRLALQQYNKAITLLAHQAPTNKTAQLEFTLMSCFLFICLELMQENYNTAIVHLMNGTRILFNSEEQLHSKKEAPFPSSLSAIRKKLNQLFRSIIIQTIFLGEHSRKLYVMPADVPKTREPFSSVSEARQSLDNLYLVIHILLSRKGETSSAAKGQEHQQHKCLLQEWHARFVEFVDRRQSTFTSNDTTAVMLLRLHYIPLSLILDTSLATPASTVAASTASFVRINDLAETLLGSSVESASTCALPNFSFDMGIIPPLYYTALNCRCSSIRWRAIALLRRAPYREGIWRASMAAQMAQRIVEVEERSAVDLSLVRYENFDLGEAPHRNGAQTFWKITFTKPAAYVRAMKVQIRGEGLELGGGKREELITW